MRISDIMTHCPHSIPADLPADAALEKMKLYGIRHLGVIEDGELIGVLSQQELGISLSLGGQDGSPPTSGEVCLRDPLVVVEETQVSEVARRMADAKSNCAIVADNEGRVVGIFTTTDACRYIHLMAKEGMELEGVN